MILCTVYCTALYSSAVRDDKNCLLRKSSFLLLLMSYDLQLEKEKDIDTTTLAACLYCYTTQYILLEK
jgi:hypothetical protein